MEKTDRAYYFSFLSVIACISVVFLHCNNVLWTFPSGARFTSAVLIQCLNCWSVDTFFMLSGAKLMDYRERYGTGKYIEKRVVKTLLPYIFWFSFATLLPYFSIDRSGAFPVLSLDFPFSPIEVYYFMSDITFSEIYWFFIPLFTAYLLIPFFSLVKKRRNAVFDLTIALLLLIYSFIPMLCAFFSVENVLAKYTRFRLMPEYFAFVLIGYQLSHRELSKPLRRTIYFFGIAGFIASFCGTVIFLGKKSPVSEAFFGDMNLFTLMVAAAVFVFCRNLHFAEFRKTHPKLDRAAAFLSECSFGVYLIHFYFVYYIPLWLSIDTGSLAWRTIGAVAVYIISVAAVYLLKKIPLIRRLVP